MASQSNVRRGDIDRLSAEATSFATASIGRWIPAIRFLRFALVGDAAGLVILGVAAFAHPFTLLAAVRIYLVLAGWCAMWGGTAALLRRAGTGAGVAVPLMTAMILFGAPITLRPVVRVIPQNAPLLQTGLIKAISIATPMLAALDGAKDSFRVSWETLPEMYRLSGLGQDVPMDLPKWWMTAAIYGLTGLACGSLAACRDRERLLPVK